MEDLRVLFIINPRSGRGQIRSRLMEILDMLAAAGCRVEVHVTQRPKDAADVAAHRGGEFGLVLCSGGDGTLNEVVSGLMELDHPPRVGYIPAGSTNDYAQSLKLPKSMAAAARAALVGEDLAVDIGKFCRDQYFLYVAGFGAFTEVSYLTSQNTKNLLGHQAYMLEGVKGLSAIKTYAMKVETESQTIEGTFLFGMVTNATSVGGMKGLVSRNVDMSDGLFEVLLIRSPKTPAELTDIVSGIFTKEGGEQVCRLRARRVHVVSPEPVDWVLDGEYGGRHHDVEIQNLKQRLIIRRGR